MTNAELHVALREVVAIGRRGGYDNDEIAEKLARVAQDYADDTLTGFTQFLASAKREDWKRWADVARDNRTTRVTAGHADDAQEEQ